MNKTDILDLVSRKLAPYMFLFGLYLVSYGHLSPGGGFQGGVVIASGVILLSLGRGVASAQSRFPSLSLTRAEAVTFVLFLAAGIGGVLLGNGFLANFLADQDAAARVPHAGFILLLNLLIGVKVGAGVSLVCMHLLRED